MAYKTINPYTNEVEKEFPNATDEELEAVLAKAHQLYLDWRNDSESLEDRKAILHRVADILRERRTEYATIMSHDMGKLIGEAEGEVDLCADICDYYADKADEFLKPRTLETDAGKAYYIKQSTGVLVAVEPWNFPFYQIARVFAPNFIIGNPMILKDASNCPASAQAFADAVLEAGAPEGSLNNMFISYDQVAKAIADKRVSGVCLTGSERGGMSVAAEAGKNLKKTTMELGGNDAFIILDDADWDLVKEVAPQARLYNAGQVCTSSKRFIVMADKYDEFLEVLKDAFSAVRMGDPTDRTTTLAPLNSKSAKEKLEKQVELAVENGAKVYYGNEKVDLPGQFFMPTILTDITPDNPIFNQEMFGPVASVYKVNSEEEAIALANNSSYGLGNTVFGEPEHAARVAAKIETGMSWINSGWASLPELPFGGVKNSGYGRELSELGFNAFVNEHLVFEPKR
ncbi:NAD-dependent succinate-semialdehyde dehydrogenase [Ligilactobacillus salivarius]|uniref:Succinate-semialdehyde dehydrogenase [NAD] / succinate-semialdehyde dehydrogenase [NADP+] n=2 Tax=Ligilactobacillus salivarius TaxID=1624 RepID=F5VC75_9LACO|nr:NAD-dependent succinate-semialdehyde dehydrogenase [Ligilactobacillus salivarius]EGL98585.1 succinate-semialdehyde dehydrogenase [NAD] / succinate-semialdehyde dehydrogenase [NADP+] [Ligilactobacillus salivarius NIAS840]MBC6926724.1 NAD-dependent succinate-semialdehyde dehydrogenase [Ligilactobacillus salivarius]MBM6788224.1 NAD-dependent succinate-semialdehyde dehydrogenase [Ligilactobacillus salivarius]MDF4187118.1 NAD-dependent succinate-semialdehyde dehydrogenase [Ligilactobacillus saliv